MARSWHLDFVRLAVMPLPVGAFIMFAGSCLITSNPEFTDPERTAPVLLADLIDPNPRELIRVNAGEPGTHRITAFVQSEDAGQDLTARVLFDYGNPPTGSGRAFDEAANAERTIKADTWSKGGRQFTIDWDNADYEKTDELGCFRVTLIVSHDFGDNGCPTEPDDYATTSWFVLVCDSGVCPDALTTCPSSKVDCQTPPPGATE